MFRVAIICFKWVEDLKPPRAENNLEKVRPKMAQSKPEFFVLSSRQTNMFSNQKFHVETCKYKFESIQLNGSERVEVL